MEDPQETTKLRNQEGDAPEKIYTGEGYMPYTNLIEIVTNYQTRQVLCEDVDSLEKLGGKFRVPGLRLTVS